MSKTVDTARQVVLINELSLEASQKGKTSLSILTNPLFFYLAPVEVVINIHPYTAFVVHIANNSKNRQSWLALTWHRNTSGIKCNITAEELAYKCFIWGAEEHVADVAAILFTKSLTFLTPKQNKTKQNKTKQNKTKQNKTKQNKTKQTKQNKTKQNKTKQNKTKQNKIKQNKTKQNKENEELMMSNLFYTV